MADTLATITYRVARELGIVNEGLVTAGSATTLVDTVNLTQADDYWNGGTAWITYDAGGASAAPEGEYSVVTDFDNGTATATIVMTAPGAGDRYAIAKKRYPLHILIQKVNQALELVGPMEFTDTTSVDTAANQTEITLPVTVRDLREVWLQTQTNDTDDNRWVLMEQDAWYIEKTATGTGDSLVFRYQLPTGRGLKLVHVNSHPQRAIYTDKIDERIDLDRLIYNAAAQCVIWRMQKVGTSDATLMTQLQYFQGRAGEAEAKNPINLPKKRAKLLIVNSGATEGDEFTTPGPP